MAVNEVAIEMSEARRIEAGAWRADSLCKKYPTHWWFAGGAHETVMAKSICASCSVSKSCLEFALGRPEILGVWASTTPNERAALRRARRAPAADHPVDSAVALGGDVHVDLTADDPLPVPVELPPPAPAWRSDAESAPRRYSGRGPVRSAPLVRDRQDRNELLTPAEAARKLGVTPNTVTRWSRAGKISAIQTMGGHRRFRRSEIERVLNEASALAAGLTVSEDR